MYFSLTGTYNEYSIEQQRIIVNHSKNRRHKAVKSQMTTVILWSKMYAAAWFIHSLKLISTCAFVFFIIFGA